MTMNSWYVNQASTLISYPTITTAGSGLIAYPYIPLTPISDPSAERDFRADRELTPVEWLRRQIDDVCLLARAA